jgi:chromosomal replication initiation ATPase DnaA
VPRELGLRIRGLRRRFGGKHHSTVIHAVRKISGMRENQPEFDRQMRGFLESFQ